MDENEIQRSLGRLEGKLDSLLLEIKQHFIDDKTNFNALDSRIQKVERKIYYASGIVGTCVFILQHFKSYIFPSG